MTCSSRTRFVLDFLLAYPVRNTRLKQEMVKDAANVPASVVDVTRCAALGTKLQETREREQRMVRLYEVGQIDEGMIARRVAQIRTERTTVQTEIADLERQIADATRLRKMQPHLEEVIAGVAGKLEEADYEHKRLAFEALQLKVKVSADGSIDISGAVPTEMPSNVSHHCTNMGMLVQFAPIAGVPFRRRLAAAWGGLETGRSRCNTPGRLRTCDPWVRSLVDTVRRSTLVSVR